MKKIVLAVVSVLAGIGALAVGITVYRKHRISAGDYR